MVFAGDELGLEGDWGEDARRHDAVGPPGDVGRARCSTTYRRLIALRRSSDALARGGIRYAHVGDDAIAYLRETPERAPALPRDRARRTRPSRLPLDALGCDGARDALRRRRDGRRRRTPCSPRDGPAFHVWRLV